MAVNQGAAVVQLQLRSSIGVGYRVQFAALDTVVLGGRGNELKQTFGAVCSSTRLLIESTAGSMKANRMKSLRGMFR